MKTIVHIELSDSERNDLARRIDRSDTSRLVTRKEVTEYTLALIQQEIADGQDDIADISTEEESDGARGEQRTGGRAKRVPAKPDAGGFVPSRGDESYLAQPKDAGIAAACSRILDDTALIESFAWETIEKNRR